MNAGSIFLPDQTNKSQLARLMTSRKSEGRRVLQFATCAVSGRQYQPTPSPIVPGQSINPDRCQMGIPPFPARPGLAQTKIFSGSERPLLINVRDSKTIDSEQG